MPAFIHYGNELNAKIEHRPVYIKDVVPTLLDLLDIEKSPPANNAKITGVSFAPLLRGASGVTQRDQSVLSEPQQHLARVEVTELFGKIAVTEYPWKAIRLAAPWQAATADEWALYNLEQDNLELKNLADEFPAKLEALRRAWLAYQERYGVVLPDWVSGY